MQTRQVSERDQRVPQEFETINLRYPDEAPWEVRNYGNWLTTLTEKFLPEWQPNDVAIQRYLPHHVGIEWHRDYMSDEGLVAVGSLESYARFDIEIYDSPAASHRESVVLHPGDLVLLRGAKLTNQADDRPYHRIHPPHHSPRTSIAFRYNTKLGV